MNRNSTTLFLVSPNATTPIPWVEDAPDFSGFTEPTLSVLQKAWQDFLDSGEELEIIPDPEPVVSAPAPQWENFNLALLMDSDFQTAAAVNSLVTNALTTALNNVMLGIVTPSGFQPYVDTFVLVSGVTQEQRNGWATIAEACFLPPEIISIMRG